ncbi:MAG: CehA/McbA family metallohydrolase [Bryobacterales bacterium]|nr:CehA/McbA family metallohydrolase [Bryobacterales bacterium]
MRGILTCSLIGLLTALPSAAQQRDTALRPKFTASLTIEVRHALTGDLMPARVYLYRGGTPHRLSPTDNLLSLFEDNFYRERIWRRTTEPKTLEINVKNQWHHLLLEGKATFEIPGGPDYRLEAYRGFFFEPATSTFALKPEEKKTLVVQLNPIAPGRQEKWISGDEHIHLMRAKEDDEVFLKWLDAEDLNVGMFLTGMRQQHFGVQYDFGVEGEARAPRRSIRSGQETRSDFYGHTLLFGQNRLIEPVSIGAMYSNTRWAWPIPPVYFDEGHAAGAIVGYAHFHGSMPHSQLLMNLVLNKLDFVEMLQYGWIKTKAWYQLLNAGLRVVGTAGCDFPDPHNHFQPWPRHLPLLGPERTMVKTEPGQSAYEAWANGIRRGAVTISNGPLLEFEVDGETSGKVFEWSGPSKELKATATAVFYRPILKVELILNGEVVATAEGDGKQREVTLPFTRTIKESSWIGARAKTVSYAGEPEIWAHANPVYLLKDGKPVYIKRDRDALRERWQPELDYYRTGNLPFEQERHRQELLRLAEETARLLEGPQPRWPRRD